jgi:enoyl-CoA hydratase/carnithine racemase
MVQLLLEALEKFDKDNKIRVIVLRGTGKFFCSGMDLVGAASMQSDSDRFTQVADRGFIFLIWIVHDILRDVCCFVYLFTG